MIVIRLKCWFLSLLIVAFFVIWAFTLSFAYLDWIGGLRKTKKLSYRKPYETVWQVGEMGKPVIISDNVTDEIKREIKEGYKKHLFNRFVSDIISVKRELPDYRDDWCKQPGLYSEKLPATSVIITFHGEAWSTLVRTVHSVLDRSPPQLLEEIILVDDFSEAAQLGQPLDKYMSRYPKVKIIRATKHQGLIRARLIGLEAARAPVVTFLDSHVECTKGWLEPLLDRIARNPKAVATPPWDSIDYNTFEYRPDYTPGSQVGIFDWNFVYLWHKAPWSSNPLLPMNSPVMAGGLFSINKDFFYELGTYDPGLEFWGGENFELSFKTWMCGGKIEMVPCSRVGHVDRPGWAYGNVSKNPDFLTTNLVRIAEVWMDDYAKYFYERVGYSKRENGDVSARVELRKKLKCKSFKWYLDNVCPDIFVPEGNVINTGIVRNKANGRCLTAFGYIEDRSQVEATICDNHIETSKGLWWYTKNSEMRRDSQCVHFDEKFGSSPRLEPCNLEKIHQLWSFERGMVRHPFTDKCMKVAKNETKVTMESCDSTDELQKWYFEDVANVLKQQSVINILLGITSK